MHDVRLTVIVPTLNEASHVADAVASARGGAADEIIVADGGSEDPTCSVAEAAGCRVLRVSPAQRARQMNAGAEAASGDVLVFLHADTVLVPGSLQALRQATRDAAVVGGGFRRQYKSRSAILKASCRIGNLRASCLGWFFGDQAIWARREVFFRLGGYPGKPVFEDLDFTRLLRGAGKTRLISPGVETSARRFRDGASARIARDIFLTAGHICRYPAP